MAQGQQGQQGPSNFSLVQKDPMRGFSLSIQGYSGIINTQPPDLIPDNATQSVYNYLPIGSGVLRKVVSPSLVVTLPNQPIKFINDILLGNLVTYVILADGSAGLINNGTYTQIQPTGTFSTNASQIDISNWQNQFFIIADVNKGLFAFQPNYAPTVGSWAASTAYVVGQIISVSGNTYWCITEGTSASTQPTFNTTIGATTTDGTVVWQSFSYSNGLLTLQPDIPGSTLLIYQGRVLIGNGRLLTYSAPLSFIDFTITNGGGNFTLTSPNLKSQIVRLLSYMNNIYIIGDHAVIVITGTTITNDPSQWYIMELFNTTGSIYPNSVMNYNNTIYLVNEYGIYTINSSQSQKVDYPIDTTRFSWTQGQATICLINNLLFYLLPVNQYSPLFTTTYNMILAYCLDLQQFFFLDFGFNVQALYATRSIPNHNTYILSNNAVYQLNSAYNSSLPALPSQITSKVFDFNYTFIYKVFNYLAFNINSLGGVPNMTLNTYCGTPTQTNIQNSFQNISQTNVVNSGEVYVGNLNNAYTIQTANISNLSIQLAFTNAYSFVPIFRLQVGGTTFAYEIVDNSNSQYDIIQTYIKGNLGRSVL
jgi:hypothetical protein